MVVIVDHFVGWVVCTCHRPVHGSTGGVERCVDLGKWGPYFGVPIGNFVGWFTVAVLSSGIFRSLEYFFPKKELKFDKSIFIIPVILYGLVALSLLGMALQFQMYELGILGSLLMVPTVLFNLFLFNKYRSR